MLRKTALDLGLKGVTVESIERRIDRLVQNGQLIPGIATAADRTGRMAITQEALRTEERTLTSVKEGKGTANPNIVAETTPVGLQAASDRPHQMGPRVASTVLLALRPA